MLNNKTLTELRAIAQSFDVPDIFQKDPLQLMQAIELKQKAMIPEAAIIVPKPENDGRLMDKPPARRSDTALLQEYAAPYVARGVKIEYTPERWYASLGKKNDEGTIRMPAKHFIKCLDRLLENTRG